MTDIPVVFDSTILSAVEKCLRYYQLRYLEGWQSTLPNDHLIFGSHFAKALERYYKLVAEGKHSDEATEIVVKLVLEESYSWDSLHAVKTRENLLRTIVWYIEQFKHEDVKVVHLANGKPAVEYSFKFEIDNGILLAGHIDRLVEYAGRFYVMDQKTTQSIVTSHYMREFSPDTQMSLYTWAGNIIYGQPIHGVIIDVAQINVGFTRFERGYIFRTPAQLEEWYRDTKYWIRRAQEAVERNHFPQNRSSCSKYGGCVFREVCARSPEVRHHYLKSDFTQGELWDPLKPR